MFVCAFLSCLPASEYFRSDVGKTKEGSIPPLVHSIANHSDKQVSTFPPVLLSDYHIHIKTQVKDWGLKLGFMNFNLTHD